MTDPIQETFTKIIQRFAKDHPKLLEIMNEAKSGDLSEQDAMTKMMGHIQANPGLEEKLMGLLGTELAPLRDKPATLPSDPSGAMFYPGTGNPKLNPLYEAGLAERAQFDGDMPELRTGPLPVGVKPAVPVESAALNPVALGRQLEEASDRTKMDINQARKLMGRKVEALASGDEATLALMRQSGELITTPSGDPDFIAIARGSRDTDPATYRRGEVPAPLKVAAPSGSELAAMTPQERKAAAYQFLSTTQGRRSAVTTIGRLIQTTLEGEGLEVVTREFDPDVKAVILSHADWTMSLGGSAATQSSFNVVGLAARALARGLIANMNGEPTKVILEVKASNTVAVRQVGWEARLLGSILSLVE